MVDQNKKIEVVFAPGCFDSFEGTQEELDDLVAEINRLVESGEFFEQSNAVDPDSLDPETVEKIEIALRSFDDEDPPERLLN